VIAIELNKGVDLRQGNRIALIGSIDYLEQDVESMQVNDQPVDLASAGTGVGIKTGFSKRQVREKMVVYRVAG
jgi:hypothetical protein